VTCSVTSALLYRALQALGATPSVVVAAMPVWRAPRRAGPNDTARMAPAATHTGPLF